MNYNDLFYDFIDRTLIIIKQYDHYVKVDEKEKFEVTLFLNCLVGLLMFPRGKEEILNLLPNIPINELKEDWGINHCPFIDEKGRVCTLKFFVERLRNSIAHARFESNNVGVLEKLTFMDAPNKKPINFITEISIKDLRTFAYKLAEFAMKNYAKIGVAI